jgi:hypothetical protein
MKLTVILKNNKTAKVKLRIIVMNNTYFKAKKECLQNPFYNGKVRSHSSSVNLFKRVSSVKLRAKFSLRSQSYKKIS